MDRDEIDRMHRAVLAALDQRLWHRVPLSGDSTETTEAVAYLAMRPEPDGMAVWYASLMETRLTPQRLAREVQRLEIDPKHAYPYFWSLQDSEGNPVAMPSQEQIELASVEVATEVAPPGAPIALFVSLRGLNTGARCLEFWHPHNAPTIDLFKVFQRSAIAVYP